MAKTKVIRREIHDREQHNKPNKKSKISTQRRKSSSHPEEEKGYDANNSEFNKLSADVVTSVFLRCPMDALSLSRCVSKSWNEFIISTSFVHSHLKQLMENVQLLVMESEYIRPLKRFRPRFVSFDMDGNKEELYTVTIPDKKFSCSKWRVCAGLVCLSTNSRIYLCNPAIRQVRELANCSPSATHGYDHFGFGYIHSRKEYKVVHFFYKRSGAYLELSQLKCEVFTLKGGIGGGISNSRWKETAEAPPYHPYLPGLSLNECIYWFALPLVAVKPDRIISFDLENECFSTISRPSAFETLIDLTLMDLKGMLCLPDISLYRTSSTLDLWILKDKVSCTWVKEYSINFVSLGLENINPYFRSWNEGIIFWQCDEVVLYDLTRKCFQKLKPTIHGRFRGLEIYSKTLFCLGPSPSL